MILGGFALALTAGCSAPSLRLTPRVGFVDLGGDFAASPSTDVSGSSSVEALGLDDTETEFIPRADFEFGPFLWTVDYGNLSFSGQGTAEATIDFGGINVAAGQDVESDIDLTLYRSTFTWDVIPTDTFDLGLGFGIGGAEVSATVADTLGNSATTDEIIPLPYAAASTTVEIGDFGVEGLAGVFAIEVDDVDVFYLDLDVNAYYQFLDMAGAGTRIVAGWRYIDVDAAYDDGDEQIDADLNFSGPYVGLTVVL